MLNDESDNTRRSVRGALPAINEFSNHKNRGLFQINEDANDEECNSSRHDTEKKRTSNIDDDKKDYPLESKKDYPLDNKNSNKKSTRGKEA